MTDTAPQAPPRWTEYMRVADLAPALRNAKAHDQVAMGASFHAFGALEPVVLDERTQRLVAGHGRVEWLATAEATDAPPPDWGDEPWPPEGVWVDAEGRWCWLVTRGFTSHDDDHAHAAGIALNRVGEKGGWEAATLVDMLDELRPNPALLEGAGFTTSQLDDLIASLTPKPRSEPETHGPAPAARQVAERVKRGEVWQLGRHLLMCGDCRNAADVDRLVGGRNVNLAVTSPPYAEQRDYDEASGFRPIPPDSYVDWFDAVQGNVARHLAEDGSWLVNIKPSADGLDTELYVMDLVLAHVRRWGWHWATEFCWERNGVPKQPVLRLKNQFEPVYQFARGRWKFSPKNVRHASDAMIVPLGDGAGDTAWDTKQGTAWGFDAQKPSARAHGGRGGWGGHADGNDVQGDNWQPGEALTAGWAYPGNRLPTFAGSHEGTGHRAAFPVGLPEFFTRLFTDPDDVVLDPFCGSGSTILAAHNAKRVGLGLELSARYCDIILDRWERHTGIDAVLAGRP